MPINNETSSGPHSSTSNNAEVVPKQLTVIPPNKSIFISRFASDTTVEDIMYYIKTKLSDVADIHLKKFTYSQPRIITSFKLTVPSHLYEQIFDSNFWPINTLIREFEFKVNPRRKNIAKLPSRNPNDKKLIINNTPKN